MRASDLEKGEKGEFNTVVERVAPAVRARLRFLHPAPPRVSSEHPTALTFSDPARLADERCIPRRAAWTGKEQYSSASTVTSWRRFAQPPEPRLRLSSLPAVVFVTSAKADGLPATARSGMTCTSNRATFIGSGAWRCPHRCSRRLHAEREQRCARGCTCMRRGSARVAAATGLVVFVVVVLVVVLVASGARWSA